MKSSISRARRRGWIGTASLSQSGCVGAFPSASAFRTALHPSLEAARGALRRSPRLDHAVQLLQQRADIADDAQIHGAVPADLLRLDVRLDELRVLPEDVAEEVEEAEPAPEEEDEVGAREGEEGRAGADGRDDAKQRG